MPLREYLAPTFEVGMQIAARRFLVAAALAMATFVLSAYLEKVWHNPTVAIYLTVPGVWLVGFLCYADTMRSLLVPTFRPTLFAFGRWSAVNVIVYLLAIACIVPSIVAIILLHTHPIAQATLRVSALYLITIFFITRFAFAAFALNDHRILSACSYSWH